MLQTNLPSDIVEELDAVMHTSTPEKRHQVLRGVTELLIGASASEGFDEALFDEVFDHLMQAADVESLAQLSALLAPVDHAPPRTVARLAAHDNIFIAGPALARSRRLGEADLREIALTKGQPHLALIACRGGLTEAVIDILLDRGDRRVLRTLLANTTATLPEARVAEIRRRCADEDGSPEAAQSHAA